MWFIALFVVSGLMSASLGQRYSQQCLYDRMRQCKDSLDRSIQKRINDMSRQDMLSHCKALRDDFNCLLIQTRCLSTEDERKRNGDVIRNSLVYIRDGCDSLGGSWKQTSCFIGDGMKTCESSYPVNSGQFSSDVTENCRKFNQFHECVMHTVKNRCRGDDDQLVGQYLVEKVQELAWNCYSTSSGYANDEDRGRDLDRDRDRSWDRDRDRDRESDNGRGYGSSSGSRSSYDRDRTRDDSRYRSDSGYTSDRRSGYDDRYGSSDRYGSNDRSGSSDRYGSDRDRNYDNRDICCRNERCDRSRMQQCRDSLTRTVDDRSSGYQDSQKCRATRNDFNCLLFQTTCLPREERDRVNDVFRRARDYISRNCDTYGRWNDNNCFRKDEMKRCESYLSSTRSGPNFEACRSYNRFKECMTDVLSSSCTQEDEIFQGAYLVDKAQEMSWQCGSDNRRDSGSSDRDRDRYFPSSDRRSPYDNSAYSSYEDQTHLDDDEEMCRTRIQSDLDTCQTRLDERRQQYYTANDFEEKQRISCCSARQFRTCLIDATRRTCQWERPKVVDSLMGKQRIELNKPECRRINVGDCSSANTLFASTVLLVCLLAIWPTSFFSSL